LSMRRVVASRRSRSRSRTPPVREKPKKIVNMLDSTAVSEAREIRRKPMSERVSGPGGERITCTIEGSGTKRTIFNRVSGGRFEGGDRSFNGGGRFEGGNRSFPNRRNSDFHGADDRGNRSFTGNDRFVEFRGGAGAPARRSFGGFRRDEEGGGMGEFRRRREGEGAEEKPVMKLVDPQEVPRSRRFFTHDDRGGDDEWRGRDMYDPRKDTGRYGGRFDRDRRDNRDFGGRRFERDDRDSRGGGGGRGGGWDGFGASRDNVNGYTGGRFGGRGTGADGVWTHDKYMELEDETDESKTVEVIEGGDDAPAENDGDEGVLVIDTSRSVRKVE
ncbi:hypothetical protein PFISCL1PPCAC_25404, partial [Pristionchus fissidentatus]